MKSVILSPHMKLAIVIAPFLLIAGYIAADYYQSYALEKNDVLYSLDLKEECNIVTHPCRLMKGGLIIDIQDNNGVLLATSNSQLQAVAFSFTYDGSVKHYQLMSDSSQKHWESSTALRTILKKYRKIIIRIVVVRDKLYYIKEMEARHVL